jgi:hypothetical protein
LDWPLLRVERARVRLEGLLDGLDELQAGLDYLNERLAVIDYAIELREAARASR